MINKIKSIRGYISLTLSALFATLVYSYIGELFLKKYYLNPRAYIYIIAILLIDYYSRKYIKNLITFLIIHIICFPMMFLVQNEYVMIVLGIITFFVFVLSINFWISSRSDVSTFAIDMPFEIIVFFILIYFHATYALSNFMQMFSIYTGILFISLYFIKLYLDKFILSSISSGQLTKEMKKSFKMNFSFIIIFIVVLLSILFIVQAFISNNAFNFIGKFLTFIFSLIFGALSKSKPDTVTPMEPTTANVITESQTSTLAASNSNYHTSAFGDTLFNAIQFVMYIAIAVIAIIAIYKIFKSLLHKGNKETDIVEDISTIEKTDRVTPKPRKKHHIFLNNKEKVRKIYTKAVKSSLGKSNKINIRKSHTADEIQTTLSKNDLINDDSFKSLTDVYKKARYSNLEITNEDVDIAKRNI